MKILNRWHFDEETDDVRANSEAIGLHCSVGCIFWGIFFVLLVLRYLYDHELWAGLNYCVLALHTSLF